VTSDSERYERGLDAIASQFGIERKDVEPELVDAFGERFAGEAIAAVGGAWPDDVLSLRDRSLIVVAALVVQGGVEARLRSHVRWAIKNGSSREELEALVTMLGVYAGYPRSSVAMEIVRDELDQLESEGSSGAE
jgi:alkylhydroperoxidase/carboxymuconolactone decarboxylase family protein YurZ